MRPILYRPRAFDAGRARRVRAIATLALAYAAGATSLLLTAPTAGAAGLPVPKVMSDAPPDKGKWRMEMLEMNGRDASAMPSQLGTDVNVCMTAADAVSRRDAAGDRAKCDTRLVEDSDTRAVVEVACTGERPVRTRSTITRAGDRVYLVQTDVQGEKPTTMKMRMSYAGTCAAGDSVVTLGKDSAVCRQARAKISSGEAAKQCAGRGEDESRCRERIAQAQARIETLCK
jgi:hypothetical protein